MPYLFIAAFLAWTVYRFAALTDFDVSPKVARAAVAILSAIFLTMAGLFAVGDWWAPAEISEGHGLGTLLLVVFNLFWLLGPIGNALFWGALGLWCGKKAWDGGWYRGALTIRRQADERNTKVRERLDRQARERQDRAHQDTERRERFARWGFAAGRSFGRFIGWR